MILFKDKNKGIPGANCIMLEVEGIGFVYISKETYEQAVILNDRFEGDIGVLSDILGILLDSHAESIEYFTETAPEPLNILSPFLAFVSDKADLGTDFEKICGALHQMSGVTDFNEITKVPKEVRANLNFSKTFVEKYKSSWEEIETKLTVTDVDIDNIKLSAIEKLIEKITPLLKVEIPTVVQQVETVTKEVPVTTRVSQPVVTEPVVEEEQEAEEAVPVLDFSVFAELLDSEPEEEKKREEAKEKEVKEKEPTIKRTITVDEIIKSKNLNDVSQDQMDKEMDEATKIAALVNKFGGN